MTNNVAHRHLKRRPSHPGMLLADILEDLNANLYDYANHFSVTKNHLEAVMKGENPITEELAERIGNEFGNGPDFWMRMQRNHDEWIGTSK